MPQKCGMVGSSPQAGLLRDTSGLNRHQKHTNAKSEGARHGPEDGPGRERDERRPWSVDPDTAGGQNRAAGCVEATTAAAVGGSIADTLNGGWLARGPNRRAASRTATRCMCT